MRNPAWFFAAAVLLLGLASCETSVDQRKFPEITFGHLPPIRLDVADIEVVRVPVKQSAGRSVAQEFPVPPGAAAERWARDRLRAVGRTGIATVIITEANAVEVPLQRTEGIRAVFTTDQSERYVTTLAMTVEAKAADRMRAGFASARAEQRRTVPEDISLADREKVWFSMTEALMQDMNETLSAEIREHLGAFIR